MQPMQPPAERTHLGVPGNQLTRALSGESFGSDVSLMSTSVISHGRRSKHNKHPANPGNQQENISLFERVLMCSCKTPCALKRRQSADNKSFSTSDLAALAMPQSSQRDLTLISRAHSAGQAVGPANCCQPGGPARSHAVSKQLRDSLLRRLTRLSAADAVAECQLDLQRDTGRPVTSSERNFMIFHWLQSVDDEDCDILKGAR